MTDFQEQIAAELSKAGVPRSAIDDAVAIFESSAKRSADGWSVGSTIKASLSHAVEKFLQAKPHFVGTKKPVGDEDKPSSIFENPDYPKDQRGEPVPMDSLTSDQLFELAGEPPPGYIKEPPLWDVRQSDFAHSGIESLDADELEPDEVPPPKDGKRYSKAEVQAMSTDELFKAAGRPRK